jgi:hypothetical protein
MDDLEAASGRFRCERCERPAVGATGGSLVCQACGYTRLRPVKP